MFGIKAKQFFQISNLLSLSRLIGALPLFYFLMNPGILSKPIVLVFVLLISFTDYFDGYFARKLNQVSELGKILDPLADKVLVISVAVAFFLTGILDLTLFLIIVLRDVLIIIPGIFLSKRMGEVPASDQIGKWTFTFIGTYLILVFLDIDRNSLPMTIYYYSLILLIIVSYLNYVNRAFKVLRKTK
ncbi:CDP-alcohol phosphatidyltransferase family protein [Ignavibacteriales bacterium]